MVRLTLVGRRPTLVGRRPTLVGHRPTLVARRPTLVSGRRGWRGVDGLDEVDGVARGPIGTIIHGYLLSCLRTLVLGLLSCRTTEL